MSPPDFFGPPPPGQGRKYGKCSKSGKIPFQVRSIGKTVETPYWIWGDLSNGKTPLICLHGGPGMSHDYLLPTALIAGDFDIPVVMYDQIGSGQSTLLPETNGDAQFWQPPLFMAELENLLSALGIGSFDLLGQSWGGMLAAQYAIERQPPGLRKMILCNSPASIPLWVEACNRLREKLPADVQAVLSRHEAANTTDSKEYEDATADFYRRHLCRVQPWPTELNATLNSVAKDATVYHTMNGPNEFHILGVIKDWTVVERLHEITTQTIPGGVLLLNGKHDEAQDEVVWPFFNRISARVKWLRFASSSHTPMLEETEDYIRSVGEFLTSA